MAVCVWCRKVKGKASKIRKHFSSGECDRSADPWKRVAEAAIAGDVARRIKLTRKVLGTPKAPMTEAQKKHLADYGKLPEVKLRRKLKRQAAARAKLLVSPRRRRV